MLTKKQLQMLSLSGIVPKAYFLYPYLFCYVQNYGKLNACKKKMSLVRLHSKHSTDQN